MARTTHPRSTRTARPSRAARRGTALALLLAAPLMVPLMPPLASAHAQTVVRSTGGTTTGSGGTEPVAPETNLGPGREGAADVESVLITLSSQATEIRQQLMQGGEMGRDDLLATERAREIATQAVEASAILGNPGDGMVTTTRMSDMDAAATLFQRMEESLDTRIAAIRAGDATLANRARLDVIDAINELPDRIRFEGRAAQGDNPTGEAGGAQPILQQ